MPLGNCQVGQGGVSGEAADTHSPPPHNGEATRELARQEPAHLNRNQETKALLPAKSLERLLLTRLTPVSKGKTFQRPRSVFTAQIKS